MSAEGAAEGSQGPAALRAAPGSDHLKRRALKGRIERDDNFADISVAPSGLEELSLA
jgi:hypothetical protein